MKHIVIGTAGHVDHGKTLLTQALTGTNTDRLKEEQQRGITIEIGFAQLTLPNGMTASIVDVPGHEKLIHNMLTGASGINIVLLVVAADEGFMPQTFEHLNILTSLGVKKGIVALTKIDLVDQELLELVKQDAIEHTKGSFLEGCPIVPVSSQTGEGIDRLKKEIADLLEQIPPLPVDKPFRLPVDRVFSVKGFGTVVTGTLIDGTLLTGDEVCLYPSGTLCKVRELQNHNQKLDTVEAGMRVAMNLGIEKDQVARGYTIASPDSMLMSNRIAVGLHLNKSSPFSVKNNTMLHFYQGTQKLVCSVRLLDRAILQPGHAAYAQLFFRDKTVVARNLDRFIIRFFSPVVTIGGGLILDMSPRKLKKEDPETIARLDQLNSHPLNRIYQQVLDSGCFLQREQDLLLRSGLSAADVHSALRDLLQSGKLVKLRGQYAAKEVLDQQWTLCETILKKHHQDESLMDGMHLGEFRERAFPGVGRAADWILDYYREKGLLRIDGNAVALEHFQTNYSPQQTELRVKMESMVRQNGILPTSVTDLTKAFNPDQKLLRQVLAKMTKEGSLVALTPTVVVDSTSYQRALRIFLDMFHESDSVAIGDYRTQMGVNRKQAELYLNYFDSRHISRLEGDHRILLKK